MLESRLFHSIADKEKKSVFEKITLYFKYFLLIN